MSDDVDRINDRESALEKNRNRKAKRRLLAQHALRQYCSDCDVEIPEARQQAMPSAARCVTCQTKHEVGRKIK